MFAGSRRPVALYFALPLLGVLCLSALTGCQRARTQSGLVPEAVEGRELAKRAEEALGGQAALDSLDFLRFDFVVKTRAAEPPERFVTEIMRRSHWWNRQTGDYRLESGPPEKRKIVLFNIWTRKGIAYEGFQRMPIRRQQSEIDLAYSHFINDTYWLTSAFKTDDEGTNVVAVEPAEYEGKSYPTFELTFDPGVGLTPKDRYHFHLDPQTWRPRAWSFVLKGQDVPPTTFLWEQYQQVGRALLPVRFDQLDGIRSILFENLMAPQSIAPTLFTQPWTPRRGPARN